MPVRKQFTFDGTGIRPGDDRTAARIAARRQFRADQRFDGGGGAQDVPTSMTDFDFGGDFEFDPSGIAPGEDRRAARRSARTSARQSARQDFRQTLRDQGAFEAPNPLGDDNDFRTMVIGRRLLDRFGPGDPGDLEGDGNPINDSVPEILRILRRLNPDLVRMGTTDAELINRFQRFLGRPTATTSELDFFGPGGRSLGSVASNEGQGQDLGGGGGGGGGGGRGFPGGGGGRGGGGGGGGFNPIDPNNGNINPSPGGNDQGPFGGLGQTGVQFGTDPLSQLISGGLQQVIENAGVDPSGLGSQVQNQVLDLLSSGGQLPNDAFALREESLREALERARLSQMDTLEGQLAERGLLSLPGVQQGTERTALEGLTRDLAGQQATALRDFAAQEADASNQRFVQALGVGAGLSQNNVRNMLDAAGLGTDRQVALANVALQNLEQNRLWNQFLAQFGLDRELAQFALQNGRLEMLLPLIMAQFQGANTAAGGAI